MQSYHFIGIAGIGMSALATILAKMGARVSGSDISQNDITDRLKKEGITVYSEHRASHVPSNAIVVYSSAVATHNPEYVEAKAKNCTLWHRSKLLAHILLKKKALLVAGSHGKTTTSSLLAHVLYETRLSHSFALGGILNNQKSNADFGSGEFLVAEADESDGSFLNYSPFGAILTNIDNDHLDFWKTSDDLKQGFFAFSHLVKSSDHFVWCFDDPDLREMSLKGESYGFHEKSDWRIKNAKQNGWSVVFDLVHGSDLYEEIQVPLIGWHNVLNSSSVFILGLKLGLKSSLIKESFLSFQGAKRRMEYKGSLKGCVIYDDYAHHPTEIKETLKGFRAACLSKKLIVVFQPHRFSRVKDCLEQFGPVFLESDYVFITDIYGAGEEPVEGITADLILQEIKKNGFEFIEYVNRECIKDRLIDFLNSEHALITMGAGDITKLGGELISIRD